MLKPIAWLVLDDSKMLIASCWFPSMLSPLEKSWSMLCVEDRLDCYVSCCSRVWCKMSFTDAYCLQAFCNVKLLVTINRTCANAQNWVACTRLCFWLVRGPASAPPCDINHHGGWRGANSADLFWNNADLNIDWVLFWLIECFEFPCQTIARTCEVFFVILHIFWKRLQDLTIWHCSRTVCILWKTKTVLYFSVQYFLPAPYCCTVWASLFISDLRMTNPLCCRKLNLSCCPKQPRSAKAFCLPWSEWAKNKPNTVKTQHTYFQLLVKNYRKYFRNPCK